MRRRAGRVGLLLLLLSAVSGCQKPLFPNYLPRTQFEQFDQVRNQSEPQSVLDEFGRRQPNVSGRLAPK